MKESNATGRRSDREFKQNAVRLVRAGRTVSPVARDLGVWTWSLGRWVPTANAGQPQSKPKSLAAETDEQRERRRLRQENASLRQPRHALMETMRNEYPVAARAKALEVSKSGFFAHRHKEAGPRRQEDVRLAAAIEPIFEESWRRCGSPRVGEELRARGQRCGKNWVARRLREAGLRPKQTSFLQGGHATLFPAVQRAGARVAVHAQDVDQLVERVTLRAQEHRAHRAVARGRTRWLRPVRRKPSSCRRASSLKADTNL